MFRSFVTSVHVNWVASGFEFSFKGWSSELRKLKNAEAMRGLERENIELICCSWRLHRLNSHWAPNKQPVTLAITGEKLNPGPSCLLVTSPFTKLLESGQLVNDVYTVTGHLVPTVVSYQSFCTQSVESFRTSRFVPSQLSRFVPKLIKLTIGEKISHLHELLHCKKSHKYEQ